MNPQAIAQEAAQLARHFGAKSAREAAEITMGRAMTEPEWERVKQIWEQAWDNALPVH